MTGTNKVRFHSKVKRLRLPERNRLKLFITALFKREKHKLLALDYIFCSDAELLKINIEYLKHDYFTDIITFDLSEGKGIIGEVYISIDRVKENAEELRLPLTEELHRVIFHGALHLCGYTDKEKRDKVEMVSKEDEYLNRYFLK